MLSVLFAALAAAANALSSVLQRKGAMSAPAEHGSGPRVVLDQLQNKLWFGGIALMTAAFLLQAAALSVGSLAVVQPVLAGELPMTLLIAARLFHRRLGWREWAAVAAMAGGLAAALAAAAPTPGDPEASGLAWAIGLGTALGALAVTTLIGWRSSGAMRAAFFGTTAGGLFGVTAALMNTVTDRAQRGVGPLFGSWQLYAMAVGGCAAVFILQQAYAAGVLAAAQPGVTLVDPVVAVVLGVTLFHEQLRLGWLSVIELIALLALVAGAIELSRSPLTSGGPEEARSEGERDEQPASQSS